MSKDTSTKKVMRERPLSPHLTIYKPQITSVLSITHRATGVFLYLGAFLYVWELVATMRGGQGFECYIGFATSWVGMAIALGWVVSLFYHMYNGIRHLFWDIGMGFEIETVTRSGIAVILATIISTIALFAALMGKGIL